ncbi:MAG: hypothetical protein PHS14_10080 [Elusimicrobia bacterium]|nr:hypothetical protein [Elusimicrobiota bacterium]
MMNIVSRKGCAVGVGLLALLACATAGEGSKAHAKSAAAAPQSASARPGETPESIIKNWAPRSRTTARLMLEKYGKPAQFDRNTLVWFNNGEWKKTIVHRKIYRHDPAGKRQDFLEQTVGYLVPADKLADLKRFNPMVEASLTAGELTFASDSESKNRLALNLAEEIVTGKRGVADARAFFLKTTRLAASGKSSSYLDKLQFEADNSLYMTPTGADQ